LIDKQWQPLRRGDVIPDSRVVRTLGNGFVELVRGQETLDLEPDTQIQIYDKAGSTPFTTVKQYFGSVSVEAEVRNVQHFAVSTPYLAAVVKGTRFTVVSGRTGSSVSVQRGHVAVEDQHDHSHVTLAVGQAAAIDKVQTAGAIEVSGAGDLPVVLTDGGKPVVPPKAKDKADAAAQAAAAALAKAKLLEKKAKELNTPTAKAAAAAAEAAAKAAEHNAEVAATHAVSGPGSTSGGPKDKPVPGSKTSVDKPDKPDPSPKPGKADPAENPTKPDPSDKPGPLDKAD
jgi:hypothetical protein